MIIELGSEKEALEELGLAELEKKIYCIVCAEPATGSVLRLITNGKQVETPEWIGYCEEHRKEVLHLKQKDEATMNQTLHRKFHGAILNKTNR